MLKRERNPLRFEGDARERSSGVPDDLVLSETAGASEETNRFLQRLNRMACIDG